MNIDEKEISCYSTRLLLQYAKENNLCNALDGIDCAEEILMNPQEWTYATIFTKLAANIEKELGKGPEVIEEIIHDVFFRDHHILFPLLIRIVPFSLLALSINKFGNRYSNKNMIADAKPLGKNKWKYRVYRATPGHYSPQMCAFNKGGIKAFLKLKGYIDINITESGCIARDQADSCTYIVNATAPHSFIHSIKSRFFFAYNNHQVIINHLEENHRTLQAQYKELLSTRDFYSHIMKNMNEAIVWLNTEGIITFSNKAFYNLISNIDENVTGNRFEKYLCNDFHSAQFKLYSTDARQNPLTPFETEFTFNENHGHPKIGAATILWIPGEHYPPGFIISIRDITDKRTIERQLSAAEDRYRSLYENSPALIVAVNLKGNFLYANPAMITQSGYTEDDLRSMHFKDLIAPQADYSVDYLFKDLIKTPGNLREVHYKTKTGEWKCIALNSYHIFGNEGKLSGIAGIGIDITETKRLNEQLIRTQRMELLGQLAGGLAHDFGNVITSINGFGKLISIKTTDEKIHRYAKSIEKSGFRAQELVKSLLAFSRNDTSENKIFDVVPIIAEVSDMLVGASSTNISIIPELPEYELFIKGDPGKIHQCILNLGINSRDALNESRGTIIFRAQRIFGQNEIVQIQIEDTGTGIPPDIIDKIYDPFFTTKEKKSGTGLGLSVVYGIIKSHNGEITVDSHPGEGTIFTLEFPSAPLPPGHL